MVIEMEAPSPEERARQASKELAKTRQALKRKLTPAEKLCVELYYGLAMLEGVRCQGNMVQSGKAAKLPAKNTDGAMTMYVRRLLRRVGGTLEMSLIAKGADDDKVAETLANGLDAMKDNVFQGVVVSQSIDTPERTKTAMKIAKLKGQGGTSKVEHTHLSPDKIARSIGAGDDASLFIDEENASIE